MVAVPAVEVAAFSPEVDEASTKFAGLVSGDLDVAGVSPTMARLVKNDPTLQLLTPPALFSNVLAFNTTRATDISRLMRLLGGVTQNGKLFFELTEAELQQFPGDWEAQGSQGAVTQHSEESLASSDRGVVMLRSLLRQMVDDVEAGRDPMNAADESLRTAESGVFTISTRAPATTAGC